MGMHATQVRGTNMVDEISIAIPSGLDVPYHWLKPSSRNGGSRSQSGVGNGRACPLGGEAE